ncbi:hypothetical protein COMNV_00033 [Commensalibacter sp. Nvir]|uniref:hypothetical protein n=1 Tax=Commensalibacter sp. Nvir TaxID=3069817 RepID=UPI002D574EF7|nr:hypothetical protein COMNV_00033 [Commensalibacter sp. Nvir]
MDAVIIFMSLGVLLFAMSAIIFSLWDILVGRWSLKQEEKEKRHDDDNFNNSK